jgi:seryl-tRNA synthetase
MEVHLLPLLAFQYHPIEHLDLERPKQRWKYHQNLQGLEKQVLLDLNHKYIIIITIIIIYHTKICDGPVHSV